MKAIKTHLKTVAQILSVLILFQGCTIYKSANVTLEEAYKSETVIRVKTNENKTHKYDRVRFENDYYYGLLYKTGEDVKIRLDENKIKKIQVKDKTFSTFLPIGILVVISGVIIWAIGNSSLGIGY